MSDNSAERVAYLEHHCHEIEHRLEVLERLVEQLVRLLPRNPGGSALAAGNRADPSPPERKG